MTGAVLVIAALLVVAAVQVCARIAFGWPSRRPRPVRPLVRHVMSTEARRRWLTSTVPVMKGELVGLMLMLFALPFRGPIATLVVIAGVVMLFRFPTS